MSQPILCHEQPIMGEQTTPEIEVIRPEVEVLPRDHSEPGAGSPGSRVWVSVDSHGRTRRLYVARPGPIATFLLTLAFGALLVVSFVLALGFFAVILSVSAVAVAGLLVYGLVRRALNRLR